MINGEVMFPTQVVYKEGAGLEYYIDKAGGLTDNARSKKTFVLYPNGSAGKTSYFLFFKKYPRVRRGTEVIVPKKKELERRRLSTGEVVGITTAITTLVAVLLQLLKR